MSYIFPNGPCVLNLSGGRTSAYMLKQYLLAYNGVLPDNVIILFQNTGKEVIETLDFLHDIEQRWKVKIIWLEYYCPDPKSRPSIKVVNYKTASRNGTPFEQLINKRNYLPNATERFCTSELKILTMKRYMVGLGYKKWYAATGFRYDEAFRVMKKSKPDTRITPYYPLFENRVTKKNIHEFWQNNEFDLNLENNNGTTPLGNCDGCFLKSEKTKAYICKNRPDSADWWAKQEDKIGGVFRNQRPWAQLIDFVADQGVFNFSDRQDIYCDNDLGGCTDY